MLSHSLRRLAGTALTALAIGTAACGGDSDSTGPAPAPADVSGTYDLTGLRTLGNLGGGGAGLPVTFTDGGGSSLRFESGHLELLADGTYSLEVEAEFNGGGVTMTDEGDVRRQRERHRLHAHRRSGPDARRSRQRQLDHGGDPVRRDPLRDGPGEVTLDSACGQRDLAAGASDRARA